MRAPITSICCTLALIAACSGGAGQATSLRGGPDGIPNSSTDNPGNGYEPPGSSNQDGPGNSKQDSPGGPSSDTSCLSCGGVYSCVVPGSENKASLLGLVPAANGCGVIGTQGEVPATTLECGGAVTSTDTTSDEVDTWSGGNGRFTVTVTVDGQTVTITCVATSQSLPTSTPVSGGSSTSTDDIDAG
ncbi:MAG: hypothetical protein ABI183_26955 [Polyangiaceae bacterium]